MFLKRFQTESEGNGVRWWPATSSCPRQPRRQGGPAGGDQEGAGCRQGRGSRLGIASPALPNHRGETCPSALPGAARVLLVPQQPDFCPARLLELFPPLPVSAASKHPGDGCTKPLVWFGDQARLPWRGEDWVLYRRCAGKDWEVAGGGLGGPAAARPWGTWQGTRVKWLSQPPLLVEAEPGAGVAPAGFLGMVLHHCSLSAARSWWGRPVPRETQPWLRMRPRTEMLVPRQDLPDAGARGAALLQRRGEPGCGKRGAARGSRQGWCSQLAARQPPSPAPAGKCNGGESCVRGGRTAAQGREGPAPGWHGGTAPVKGGSLLHPWDRLRSSCLHPGGCSW